jgi:hypothetical protein
LACRCQDTDINETIDLLRIQATELENIIIEQEGSINKLHTTNDSLLSVIGGLEETPSSFIANLDTAYIFVYDNYGNSIEVWKTGTQINTQARKDTLRLSAFWSEERRVYFMDSLRTKASLIEDGYNYHVSSEDWEIKIDKK